MPELPEVETIRSQLSSALVGLTIKDIKALAARVFLGDPRSVIGKTVKKLRRFGKVLVIDLDSGVSMVIHLKMTGRLVYKDVRKVREVQKVRKALKANTWDIDYASDKHTHVVITFTNGDKLYFNDVRKFGWIQLVKTSDVEKISYIAKLGPEFFSNPPTGRAGLTIEQFSNVLKTSHNFVKQVLMDQERIAGVRLPGGEPQTITTAMHLAGRAKHSNTLRSTTVKENLARAAKHQLKNLLSADAELTFVPSVKPCKKIAFDNTELLF